MKKVIALLLGFCMLMPLTAFANEIPSEETELIDNGGFEKFSEKTTADGTAYLWPDGWTLTGREVTTEGIDYKLSDKFAKSGKYAMMSAGGRELNTTRMTYPLSNLTPGAVYEIKGSVLIDGSLGQTGVFFEARQTSGSGVSYCGKSHPTGDTYGKWVDYVAKFVAPANGKAFVWLYKYGAGGDAYFDDFSVRPVNSGLAINGSFEYLNPDGTPQCYVLSNAAADTREVYDGKTAIKVSAGGKISLRNNYVCNSDDRYFVPGDVYALSFMAQNNGRDAATATITYFNAEKQEIKSDTFSAKSTTKEYEKFSFDFTVPEDAATVALTLNGSKSGNVYYDALEINSEKLQANYQSVLDAIAKANAPMEVKLPVEGTGELIQNGDFETLNTDGNGAEGFTVYGSNWGEKGVTLSMNDPQSGKYCVQLKGNESQWVCATIPVTGGAEYQVTAWLKRISVTNDKGPYIKFEFYDESGANFQSADSQSFILNSKVGKWSQVAALVTVPDETVKLKAYFRISGGGEVFFDNVSCTMTEMPNIFQINTDEIFYYTDAVGRLTMLINTKIYPIGAGAYYDVTLKDGETTLLHYDKVPTEGETVCCFDADAMPEKGKAYTLCVTYKNADGSTIEAHTTEIYRYDRPKYINENGELEVDGKILPLVEPYGLSLLASPEEWAYAEATKGNMLGSMNGWELDKQLQLLDDAATHGYKVVVSLYIDMLPAGAPDNAERTKQIVAAVKDHPALLGYHVMDEPYLHGIQAEVTENLKNSYKIIRDIDPYHPVMLLETPYNAGLFEFAGKFCDFMWVDPYPAGKANLTKAEKIVEAAQEAVNYEKPICSLVQAFDWNGYLPTANDMRYQTYGSLFAAADGYGYYKYHSWSETTPHLWEYNAPDGMWAGITYFADNEREDALNLFIFGQYPVLNYVKTDDINYILYVKNNDVYLVAMNKKTESLAMDIPLTSYDGSITLGAFSAEAVDISGAPAVSGNGSFSLTLDGMTVAKYKLTLSETPDFSGITPMTYRDLGRHSWARKAIETLKAKNIVNDVSDTAFRPGKNITRGEFALFLVNTLGLTSESTENFSDVADCTEYAKAVAIGKASGILNGVGDNRYQPEKAITRQDLMTIIARALALVGEEDTLAAFPDAASVADYARSSVSAMVQSGLVKGNADGTLNPRGNTTRAEAAVIMERILER